MLTWTAILGSSLSASRRFSATDPTCWSEEICSRRWTAGIQLAATASCVPRCLVARPGREGESLIYYLSHKVSRIKINLSCLYCLMPQICTFLHPMHKTQPKTMANSVAYLWGVWGCTWGRVVPGTPSIRHCTLPPASCSLAYGSLCKPMHPETYSTVNMMEKNPSI